MKCSHATLLAALATLCVINAAPALAQFEHRNFREGEFGQRHAAERQFGARENGLASRTASRAAPGPVAGAGLPFLIVAGAGWLIRRRREKARPPGSAAQP